MTTRQFVREVFESRGEAAARQLATAACESHLVDFVDELAGIEGKALGAIAFLQPPKRGGDNSGGGQPLLAFAG
jgi:hypothetical protein